MVIICLSRWRVELLAQCRQPRPHGPGTDLSTCLLRSSTSGPSGWHCVGSVLVRRGEGTHSRNFQADRRTKLQTPRLRAASALDEVLENRLTTRPTDLCYKSATHTRPRTSEPTRSSWVQDCHFHALEGRRIPYRRSPTKMSSLYLSTTAVNDYRVTRAMWSTLLATLPSSADTQSSSRVFGVDGLRSQWVISLACHRALTCSQP